MLEYQNYIFGNFSHGLMNDGFSPVAHISFRRLVQAVQMLYKSGFARTVLSQDGNHLSFGYICIHIDQCMEAVAEGLAQIVHCDNWLLFLLADFRIGKLFACLLYTSRCV